MMKKQIIDHGLFLQVYSIMSNISSKITINQKSSKDRNKLFQVYSCAVPTTSKTPVHSVKVWSADQNGKDWDENEHWDIDYMINMMFGWKWR